MPDNKTSPTRGANGEATEPPVTRSDTDNTDNSASTLIEAPVKPGRKNPLDQHEFTDGGGGGGAEAFRRKPE
ncbi:hypothetical protein [Polaromonas eurypsychrophila]|uniref:Uncharacterized protein n=1 Tax=Polaromonas eurypsychrophila TaxID=1614635 RepID=A0A916SU99_9BURK|nr:hypothetical protein [Polaromonas eurypsychrophila]GGB14138.1 hypothetical protein GCM10011496_38890 [Polaromonas eurypsychrophila]